MKMRLPLRSFRSLIPVVLALLLPAASSDANPRSAATPIAKVVVIFQENVSFDHYFATYPRALNPPGEPAFLPSSRTPAVNGLTAALLTHNPNSAPPFRLDRSHVATCDQDHDYTPEQQALHAGLMDRFVEFTGNAGSGCDPKVVMAYFDGNTVTGLWNYAQAFAMSDNFFDTQFGPSTPGHLNLVSGQTHGVIQTTGDVRRDVIASSVIGDAQPFYDDCSSRETVAMGGKNVGDLLNQRGITWGWFQGGFKPTATKGGKAVCGAAHTGSDGKPKGDYIPHHEPFQYYASTSNPHHLAPTSVSKIGLTDQANHQYDLSDFWNAVAAGNLPSVSFLKAPGYRDGHAGYSDPLAEQTFLTDVINRLEQTPYWREMAIIVTWDDSDGWYDHVMPPIVNKSNTSADTLTGSDCGTPVSGTYLGRCGYGQRLPLLVISPYARENSVDHTTTDFSSILRFIEDNWHLGRIGDQSFDALAAPITNMFDFGLNDPNRRLLLDTRTGVPVEVAPLPRLTGRGR